MGTITWISKVRPDIQFVASALSCFVANPVPEVYAEARHCLMYLKQTRNEGVSFYAPRLDKLNPCESMPKPHQPGYESCLSLHLITDANLPVPGNTVASARANFGVSVMLAGAQLAGGSKRLHSVATDTMVAELMALSAGVQTLLPIMSAMRFLGYDLGQRVPCFTDNDAAVRAARSNESIKRSAHAMRRIAFVVECEEQEGVKVDHVVGEDNPADAHTKVLSRPIFLKHTSVLRGRRFN